MTVEELMTELAALNPKMVVYIRVEGNTDESYRVAVEPDYYPERTDRVVIRDHC
jgi:hypothetical protein